MTQLLFEPPLAAASVAWEHRGKLRATVVLKASFAMTPGGPLEQIAAAPLRPDELAFTLTAAEVIARGPALAGPPHLTVSRGGQPVIDKRGEPGKGFGALPPTDPARAQYLAGLDPATIDRACEIGELMRLPNAFDRAFFHRAPNDQRVPGLRGGETLLLKNLHPQFAEVAVKIPQTQTRTSGDLSGTVVKVDMSLDTIDVDTQKDVCTLLWRGRIAANRPESFASTRVRLALDIVDPGFSAMHGAATSGSGEGFDSTIVLPDGGAPGEQGDPLMGTMTMEDGPPPSSAAIPFEQSGERPAPPPSSANDFQAMLAGGTVTLSPEDVAAKVAAAAIPFDPSAPEPPKPSHAQPGPAKPPVVQPPPVVAPTQPAAPVSVPTIDPEAARAAVEGSPPAPPVADPPPAPEPPEPEPPPAPEPPPEPEPPPAPEPPPEKVIYDPAAPKPDAAPAPEPPARKRPDIRASLYKKPR